MAKVKEKRNLFQTIFGVKNQEQSVTRTQLQMLNGFNPYFSTMSENIYDSKVARTCIDRIATHCAKLIPKHIQNNLSRQINGDINFLLQHRPNPLMSTYDFIYKTISMLYTDSNAFIYIQKGKGEDGKPYIKAFYPVLASTYELLQGEDNRTYLQFQFINGQMYTIPYLDLIHLRLFYNKNDVYGTSNRILRTDLETAQTTSEGIKNAIRTSNNLKGILKFTNSMLKPKDIKENQEQFVKDYLSMSNTSGIATLDAKAEFQPLDLKPITLDKAQMEQVNYNIYDYFGISESIVRNKFTPTEWNAFFEGVIEPRAIQMGYEFTNKIFTDEAIREGHKIVFTANRLQYAELGDKIKMFQQVLPYGMLTVDEAREILDLAPMRRRCWSKNFAVA